MDVVAIDAICKNRIFREAVSFSFQTPNTYLPIFKSTYLDRTPWFFVPKNKRSIVKLLKHIYLK